MKPRYWPLISAVILQVLAVPAAAQPPAGYYAGKQVKMIIGLGTGGGYDLWARMVARHIGRHLPGNPTVIAQNMEGAAVSAPRATWRTRPRATAP
jgi:tripartite-type tricarboxylate transporter receptor subunit TctC